MVLINDHLHPTETSDQLPAVFADQLAQVKLSYVDGPDFIIVHLRSQLEDLQRLQVALRGMTKHQRAVQLCEVAVGSFIAYFKDSMREMAGKRIWCRVVVTHARKTTLKV